MNDDGEHFCRLNGELREISGRMLRMEQRMTLLERDITILLAEVRRVMPVRSPSEFLEKKIKNLTKSGRK